MSRALTLFLKNQNDIGDIGAGLIAEGLKVNSSLTELHLVSVFIPAEILF
jgi:hypothetical protein